VASDGKTAIWRNGKMIPFGDAVTHVLSHALHYGTAVFEGIRAYAGARGTAVFRLREHIERLFVSAKAYKIAMPVTPAEVEKACVEVIRANGLEACYLRPLAFLGHGPLGVYAKNVPTDVIVAAFPWGAYLGAGALEHGIRATISSWRRLDHAAFPTTAKGAGHYMNSGLAVREAKEKGFEEAILLDARGYVSEGSGENLFLVVGGTLVTPGLAASILPGITRDAVLALAKDLAFPVDVRDITRAELYAADEAFFTGTAAEITPIREVDGYVIGSGRRGPVTERLQTAFFRAVKGEDPTKTAWLTPV
jgi:branched-chain amino acid aminotransferase